MSLKDKLRSKTLRHPSIPLRNPLWCGPIIDGVTFSMLSRFLVCRERFRVSVIEGIRPVQQFNHRIEYGQMWHVCEEALAREEDYREDLGDYVHDLMVKYPFQSPQITHWYNVCYTQFPEYVRYWEKNSDVLERTPVYQEKVFDIPYTLPSRRVVRLRGKFDSVDVIGKGDNAGLYLQENKTKGEVNENQIKRQLTFDLQTMMYLTALSELLLKGDYEELPPLKGVRYNVVRRPLSGGKGSIVRHKARGSKPEESEDSFYGRLRDIIRENPQDFFIRLKSEVQPSEIVAFRERCLDPILESLCNWYSIITNEPLGQRDHDSLISYGHHWVHPFGVRNILDEGGNSDLDEYLMTGSMVGLERVDKLFTELT